MVSSTREMPASIKFKGILTPNSNDRCNLSGAPMNSVVKSLSLAFGLLASVTVQAETYIYEAITDFTDIEAGEVPYYIHGGVNALAINAANESFRDKFARATVEFEHPGGVYDVTITSLGETDGDGTFRFLIDGEVVGSSVNEPATEDYGNQYHTFENVTISEGALIGVESIAVSNGLIPEGDAYAYARGRWTVLTIETAEDNTPDPVVTADLSIDLATDNAEVTSGDTINFTATVVNLSGAGIATNPLLTLTFPEAFTNLASENCSPAAGTMTLGCTLPELSFGDSTTVTVSAVATSAGTFDTFAEVNADQSDPDTSSNSVAVSTTVIEAQEPIETPTEEVDAVDLSVSIEADKSLIEVGDSVTYTVTMQNLSAANAATAPVVGIQLPDSLQFEASNICTSDGQSVRCETEELSAGSSTAVSFTARAISVNSYAQLYASASSDQPEDNTTNNETQMISNINPVTLRVTPDATPQTDTQESASQKSSGGGSTGISLLLLTLLLLPFGLFFRRINYRS